MTEAKRRKRLIKEGEAAFRAEVDSWMPKPKFKPGDRVRLIGDHPLAGEEGIVIGPWYGGYWSVRMKDKAYSFNPRNEAERLDL
jgi:hypothetical protein